MPTCPICAKSVTDDATECPKCHLPAVLFDAVREAVGPPTSDPATDQELSELVAALEETVPDRSLPDRPISRVSSVAQAVRFPAPNSPRVTPSTAAKPPATRGLPALPPGHGPELWKKQVAEYLRLARRRGMDVTEFAERSRRAIEADDPASFEVLSRDLFVHVAAGLTDDLETLDRRREELAVWSSTASLDAELDAAESALAMGDLAGAERRIRQLSDEVSRLEDQWATIQILETEGSLMGETLVELGGDPSPVRGATEEGLRLAREGRRSEAERLLARANLALWTLLAPRLTRDLSRLKTLLVSQRTAGADMAEAADLLREIAIDLRRRNYGALVAAYRRLRSAVDGGPLPSTAAMPADHLEVAR